jgi:hypothetical protein
MERFQALENAQIRCCRAGALSRNCLNSREVERFVSPPAPGAVVLSLYWRNGVPRARGSLRSGVPNGGAPTALEAELGPSSSAPASVLGSFGSLGVPAAPSSPSPTWVGVEVKVSITPPFIFCRGIYW